jgi:hypothetical protein
MDLFGLDFQYILACLSLGFPARCSRLRETTAGGVAETKNCDSGSWRAGDRWGERHL